MTRYLTLRIPAASLCSKHTAHTIYLHTQGTHTPSAHKERLMVLNTRCQKLPPIQSHPLQKTAAPSHRSRDVFTHKIPICLSSDSESHDNVRIFNFVLDHKQSSQRLRSSVCLRRIPLLDRKSLTFTRWLYAQYWIVVVFLLLNIFYFFLKLF